jgi:hypothetical protein
MTVTVEIPDTIAGDLAGEGRDPVRAVLEAIAIEGYRTNRLSEYQIQQLLGFGYFEDVHRFLNEHGVPPHYSVEDWEQDLAEARRYPQLQASRNSTEHRVE